MKLLLVLFFVIPGVIQLFALGTMEFNYEKYIKREEVKL